MHHFMPLLYFVLVKFDLMTLQLRGLNLLIGHGLKVGVVMNEQLMLLSLLLRSSTHSKKMLLTSGESRLTSTFGAECE